MQNIIQGPSGVISTSSVDIDGTDQITIDSEGKISIDGTDDSNFTVTGSAKDLDLVVAGGGTQELRIASAGTGANALSMDATAGSMVIGPSLANGKTLKIGPNGATEMVFTPHGTASSEKISLTNTAGTANDAIKLLSTAGGITIDGGNGTIQFADNGASLGTITSSGYSGNVGTATTATTATNVTVTDNEDSVEDNVITFVAGGAGSGNVGLEADGNLTYNPSTGKVTAIGFIGALTGNASGSSGSCTGNAATATNLSGVNSTAAELNILDESAVSVSALSTEAAAGDDGVLTYDHNENTISWKTLATICFLEGTKITLSDKTQKNIEEIETNDYLLSYEFKNLDNYKQDLEYLMNWYSKDLQGSPSRTQVSKLWENETDQYYTINDKLRVTPEHLLFIRKNGKYEWYPAKNIKKGYYLLTSKNIFEKIESLELVEERTKVYNLKLDGIMNYYADDYLVHCSSKCDECENIK